MGNGRLTTKGGVEKVADQKNVLIAENLLLDTGEDGVLDLMNRGFARRCAQNRLREALGGVVSFTSPATA